MLFNIKVIRNFQMNFLSMFSKIHFFQFSFSWENCSFEKFKETVDLTFKVHTPLKRDLLKRTRFPYLIKL